MTLVTGVGFSEHRNPSEAGRLAAEMAMAQANLSRPDFVFLFGSIGYRQDALLRAVRQATGNAPLSGCSGEGLIIPGAVHETNFGVVVGVVGSDEVFFRNASAVGMKDDALGVGRRVGTALELGKADDALALVTLADGLTLNFDAILRGLMSDRSSLNDIPMVGGTASDNWTFTQTYQYCNDEVMSDGVVSTLIHGKGELLTSIRHGCVPVGDELVITRAESNRILEIDNRRALDVIDEYLTVEEREGDWKKTNVYLAIGIKAPEYMRHYDDYLIRFMPMRDEEGGGIYVPTELSEGTRFFMTRRDHDKIASGNARMADELRQAFKGRDPRFLLQIECIGRGQVIFNETEKQTLLKNMQQGVAGDKGRWFGLYTYGEFGPVGGINCFHNYSLILTAIM